MDGLIVGSSPLAGLWLHQVAVVPGPQADGFSAEWMGLWAKLPVVDLTGSQSMLHFPICVQVLDGFCVLKMPGQKV
jgi:hypothetical protein